MEVNGKNIYIKIPHCIIDFILTAYFWLDVSRIVKITGWNIRWFVEAVTRITVSTTIIDFTSNLELHMMCGIFYTEISDNLPLFQVILTHLELSLAVRDFSKGWLKQWRVGWLKIRTNFKFQIRLDDKTKTTT